ISRSTLNSSAFRARSQAPAASWRPYGHPPALPEQSIGSRAISLAGDVGERCLVGTLDRLARPSRRSAQQLERFQVVRIDHPHETQLGSVKALSQKQSANVSLRCVEFGGHLGYRQKARAFHAGRRILARARNHFWHSEDSSWTKARVW